MITKPPKEKFGGWSIDEQEWDALVCYLDIFDRPEVVEFGLGTSTLLFSQMAKKVVTYETNRKYVDSVNHIPKNVEIRFYDSKEALIIPSHEKLYFDIAFVDGPPANHIKQGTAREVPARAARIFSNRVIMHDTKRVGESNTIDLLFKEWDCMEFGSARGLTLFWRYRK